MTLVYFQLSKPYLKEELLGYLWIGYDVVPLYFPLKGEIVFEFSFEGHLNIAEADKKFLQETSNKKMPGDVVCYCKEFPTGGWNVGK